MREIRPLILAFVLASMMGNAAMADPASPAEVSTAARETDSDADQRPERPWRFVNDLQIETGVATATTPWLATDSGSVAQGLLGAASETRFQRPIGGGRFFQLGVGLWAVEGRQSSGGSVEPSWLGGRLTAEADLPWSIAGGKRVTVGGLFGKSRFDFGDRDFGDTTTTELALMLPWSIEDRCVLRTVTLFIGEDSFDDRENDGSPAFDRSGDYGTYGAEVAWLTGVHPDNCERVGPFRIQRSRRNWNARIGWRYRDESTAGTDFDARFNGWYFVGQAPLWPRSSRKSRPGASTPASIDMRLDVSRSAYRQNDRLDDSLRAELAARWAIIRQKSFIRDLDFLLGIYSDRRDSLFDAFDFTATGVFFGFDIRFSPDPGGPSTGADSSVRVRGESGGSDPKVEGDAMSGGG